MLGIRVFNSCEESDIALIVCGSLLWFQGEQVMGKKAVVIVGLVDESATSSNSAIAEEILHWFTDETLPAPWVKKVTTIRVQGD